MTALGTRCGWDRRWCSATTLVVAASFVAVSWRFGLWLFVVGAAAGALSLVVAERLRRYALAHRVATWALQAPGGRSEPAELERVIASDVASLALADVDVLAAASRDVDRSVDDAWLRALALERFETARQLVAAGEVGASAIPTDLTVRRCVVLATTAVTVCTLVALMTEHPLFLVLLTGAMVVLAAALQERSRRTLLPRLMVAEAITPPVAGVFTMPEPAVVQALVTLAHGRSDVLASAARVARYAPGAQALRAEGRLAQAAARCGRQPTAVHTTGVLVTLTAVAIVIAEVLT